MLSPRRSGLRLADGAANPYLLQAGIEARKLPQNLLDAVRLFAGTSLLPDLVLAHVKLKRAEWDACARHLSPWERDDTLEC